MYFIFKIHISITDCITCLLAYVKKICLFGGAGFVGSSIVRLLAKRGFELKIATRTPFDEDLLELKSTVSDPGQITIEKINIHSNHQIKNFIRGSKFVLI